MGNGRDRESFGVDNPNAALFWLSPDVQELFGVASLDLFLSTFCLTQPLPSPNDLTRLCGLLAGAVRVAADVALRKPAERNYPALRQALG